MLSLNCGSGDLFSCSSISSSSHFTASRTLGRNETIPFEVLKQRTSMWFQDIGKIYVYYHFHDNGNIHFLIQLGTLPLKIYL